MSLDSVLSRSICFSVCSINWWESKENFCRAFLRKCNLISLLKCIVRNLFPLLFFYYFSFLLGQHLSQEWLVNLGDVWVFALLSCTDGLWVSKEREGERHRGESLLVSREMNQKHIERGELPVLKEDGERERKEESFETSCTRPRKSRRAAHTRGSIARAKAKRFARNPSGGATAFRESPTRSRYDRKFTSRGSVSIR